MRGPRKILILGEKRKCGKPNSHASFFLQATSDEVVGVFKAYAIGLLDNSDIFKSNARAPMCACAIFYGIQDSRKFVNLWEEEEVRQAKLALRVSSCKPLPTKCACYSKQYQPNFLCISKKCCIFAVVNNKIYHHTQLS